MKQNSQRKKEATEKSVTFFHDWQKLFNSLPVEASHGSLYISWRRFILSSFSTSFGQKISPLFGANGMTVKFGKFGDQNILNELQNIYLSVKCRFLGPFSDKRVYDAPKIAATDSLFQCLSVFLLRTASKFPLLLAITLRTLSLKQKF